MRGGPARRDSAPCPLRARPRGRAFRWELVGAPCARPASPNVGPGALLARAQPRSHPVQCEFLARPARELARGRLTRRGGGSVIAARCLGAMGESLSVDSLRDDLARVGTRK